MTHTPYSVARAEVIKRVPSAVCYSDDDGAWPDDIDKPNHTWVVVEVTQQSPRVERLLGRGESRAVAWQHALALITQENDDVQY